MAKTKFPSLIHVTQETLQDGEDYLQVREGGVLEEDIDSNRPCAIYKLVSEGEVQVSRSFVEKKPRRGRKS